MSGKRKLGEIYSGDEFTEMTAKQIKRSEGTEKHTLDSDEEDSGDDERYNVMDENDIEGEEDGIAKIHDGVRITPFNMKEELEEGHFDSEGHFHWNKNSDIKDNWLDNIDWYKVKEQPNIKDKSGLGLADSDSDSDDEDIDANFDVIGTYKSILELMEPRETVKKALQRHGSKVVKLSSAERWRRKKEGIIDTSAELVTKLTELTNDVLTKTGNMDIYQETYEFIAQKIKRAGNKSGVGGNCSKAVDDDLDMYADDFDTKEKVKLDEVKEDTDSEKPVEEEEEEMKSDVLMWEFKWKQTDEEIHGPYQTEQMQNWVDEGYFKEGVFVRKVGIADSRFYQSNRIDFELYL